MASRSYSQRSSWSRPLSTSYLSVQRETRPGELSGRRKRRRAEATTKRIWFLSLCSFAALNYFGDFMRSSALTLIPCHQRRSSQWSSLAATNSRELRFYHGGEHHHHFHDESSYHHVARDLSLSTFFEPISTAMSCLMESAPIAIVENGHSDEISIPQVSRAGKAAAVAPTEERVWKAGRVTTATLRSSSRSTLNTGVAAPGWASLFSSSTAIAASMSTLAPPPPSAPTRLHQAEDPVEQGLRDLHHNKRVPLTGYGPSIQLTDKERNLFNLLRQVRSETGLDTTLRVAGGWVRDKLLATDEFKAYHKVFEVAGQRLTSKFRKHKAPSMGRLGTKVLVSKDVDGQPVDIDIALDDMLGREYADHLNEYLQSRGKDTVSVGVVLKNPEKSKHLETATMKVGSFWIDFVNLRAEEYTQTDSRIPDLMRIGSAEEDAFRRDLTINALFYNINTGQVEDWTGRGFEDLRKGIVATPLPALTTLLDDPLRVLRSIRFAARLRFTMDEKLTAAAMDPRVRNALAQKVSRERVGCEIDLMLRSPDPVGAVRLLMNLGLADTVFPMQQYLTGSDEALSASQTMFNKGLSLLSTCHDHLADCRLSPPLWCTKTKTLFGFTETRLTQDPETRRLLWYASFLKPLHDESTHQRAIAAPKGKRSKKANRSTILKLLVDDLKRPSREAEAVEKIMKAADEFTHLLNSGCDISATMILLSEVEVSSKEDIEDQMLFSRLMNDSAGTQAEYLSGGASLVCTMNGRIVDSAEEIDPVWQHAMEFRSLCSAVMQRAGPLWRAALFLSLAEQLAAVQAEEDLFYAIQGDVVDESQEERRSGVVERYDVFATALQRIGLVGIWNEKPLLDGAQIKAVLPNLPKGPEFRSVMQAQCDWMVARPGANAQALATHLRQSFADFC